MKSALVFFTLVALSQAGVPLLRAPDGRVVNGEDVGEGERPFQVSLQTTASDEHFCGSAIISTKHVLTAAHCVERRLALSIKVVCGVTNLLDRQTIHRVGSLYKHINYVDHDSWRNDIALLKIWGEFEFSKKIAPVSLPKQSAEVAAGSSAVVSGWGSIREGTPITVKLQRTNIEIADQLYCRKVYTSSGFAIHDTQICVYDPIIETGACHGDSGGPLTINGTLVGLVSWGNGCGSRVYPSVYTSVSEYINWINLHAV